MTPQLLKATVTDGLNALLKSVQEDFLASKEWQEIEQKAYPPPPEPAKKVKTKKNKGTGAPGLKDAKVQPDGSVEGKDTEKINVGANVDAALEKLDIKE